MYDFFIKNISISSLTASLLISIIGTIFILILTTLLKIRLESKEQRYDIKEHRALIEEMRRSIEKELYAVNNRIMSEKDRWQDVNHLLISSQGRAASEINLLNQIKITNFLESFGLSEKDLVVDKELIFVLTPFHPEFEPAYQTISKVCNKIGMRCLRGDETFITSEVMPHIVKLLAKSRLVIANIEGRNANVFYELGIAHGIDKPTILISKGTKDLPFDLKSKKILIYNNLEQLEEMLYTELARSLVK